MPPRNADDAKYFFIVSQFSHGRLVINIRKGIKSGILEIVKPDHGRPSQLWRWDDSCRLVSKLGLVADIKGESKKEEAICHAWIAHDGLSQKWRVEKGAIKNNLIHLVIDGSPPRVHVLMKSFDECNEHQKWHFVPEDSWDDFQLSLTEPNPLKKALFWKNMAESYLDVIMGYSIKEFELKVHKAYKVIDECTSSLEEIAKGTGIARKVGGGVSVAGGAVALVCLSLAPFTGGATLPFAAGGAVGLFTGTATSLATNLVHGQLDEKMKGKVNEATASLFGATYNFHSLLGEYSKYLREADEYLERMKHLTRAESNASACTTSQAEELKRLVAFTLPVEGETLTTAGSTRAEDLSRSLAGFGVLAGILDIYSGVKTIASSRELAEEFRQSSECLKKETDRLIRLYKKLHQNEESTN